jgi:hypothetical protein
VRCLPGCATLRQATTRLASQAGLRTLHGTYRRSLHCTLLRNRASCCASHNTMESQHGLCKRPASEDACSQPSSKQQKHAPEDLPQVCTALVDGCRCYVSCIVVWDHRRGASAAQQHVNGSNYSCGAN